jgi:predicted site-specific integrase-resolvase
MYVASKDAQKFYNVTANTLRRWANNGTIKYITTQGGHRRYYIQDKNDNRQTFIYARVSSKKQEQDLQRQIKFLKNKYPKHQVITDISSGINYNRKGLNSLLEQVFQSNVKEIVVFSQDRLARFGFDLIQNICTHFHTKLIIENSKEQQTYEQELAEDLLSVVTVFTARYHGSRKYKNS